MSRAESAIEFYTPRVRIFYTGELALSKIVSLHYRRAILIGGVTLVASVAPSFSQDNKILGGYFEECSIYYAGYNIANLHQNGVAGRLTHLMYAFANVTTRPAPACSICGFVGRLSDSLASERERASVLRTALR